MLWRDWGAKATTSHSPTQTASSSPFVAGQAATACGYLRRTPRVAIPLRSQCLEKTGEKSALHSINPGVSSVSRGGVAGMVPGEGRT